jgi:hypothetical protein
MTRAAAIHFGVPREVDGLRTADIHDVARRTGSHYVLGELELLLSLDGYNTIRTAQTLDGCRR